MLLWQKVVVACLLEVFVVMSCYLEKLTVCLSMFAQVREGCIVRLGTFCTSVHPLKLYLWRADLATEFLCLCIRAAVYRPGRIWRVSGVAVSPLWVVDIGRWCVVWLPTLRKGRYLGCSQHARRRGRFLQASDGIQRYSAFPPCKQLRLGITTHVTWCVKL